MRGVNWQVWQGPLTLSFSSMVAPLARMVLIAPASLPLRAISCSLPMMDTHQCALSGKGAAPGTGLMVLLWSFVWNSGAEDCTERNNPAVRGQRDIDIRRRISKTRRCLRQTDRQQLEAGGGGAAAFGCGAHRRGGCYCVLLPSGTGWVRLAHLSS